jgi:hypothetical protein
MTFRKNISNLLGWNTNRKIIVIESDDWGSIRIKSKEAFHKMSSAGLDLLSSNFTSFDSLESNSDLLGLYSVLQNHKDITGRNPVFTPMCIVANPNFEKIKEGNFQNYYYESFIETCKRYPEHDKVHNLWLDGVTKRLFVPELHGREHLNVVRWIKALKLNNEGLKLAFDNESIGVAFFRGESLPEHLAAFHPESKSEIPYFNDILSDAGTLFENILGYKPRHFIASNSSEPRCLETTLKEIGVKYLTRYKIQKYPLGDGKFETCFNWLGKRNSLGQVYLTRNASFEPSDFNSKNPVQSCLNDIEIAFKWRKPAIISSHRVNYIGFINKENSKKGLNLLDELLMEIIKRWPDCEFMTSVELANIISRN